MMRSWKAKQTLKVTATERSETIRRVRNSSRCSTRVASSPCWRRRGSLSIFLRNGVLALARSRSHDLVPGRGELLRLRRRALVLGDARDGVLELAHSLAERTAHLGKALRSEEKQDQEEQNQKLRHADSERSEERRVGKECRSRWSPYQ